MTEENLKFRIKVQEATNILKTSRGSFPFLVLSYLNSCSTHHPFKQNIIRKIDICFSNWLGRRWREKKLERGSVSLGKKRNKKSKKNEWMSERVFEDSKIGDS